MTPRNPFVLIFASIGTIFGAVLVGVIVWVAMNSPRPGPFDVKFSLVDDKGEQVDQGLFKGSPSLVYFGYTNCPEVCPTTLFEVAGYLKDLGPEGSGLKTYFFSVDPERDTPEVMHGYVTAFTDRIRGITGRPDEMQKVIEGWMIYAAKLPSEDGDYHMSHTMSLLLIGADGRLKGLLPYGAERDRALEQIRKTLL
ncbi:MULTISPECIES: SCO family protein [unclassified Shinella]|jgi:protein SCO1/2|uniref:SCO family protein n=1 Tax=unclassified Shinella TaxID=2643062 RepID=UPI00102D4286|nr:MULTISPECIES: SCO family protein [unclassified Shinella]MCO5154466.1 SCO family protein [Shinella sp.]MDC7264406.1 SCO family protein [Shinella sp. HY16]MDC7271302.1 SCO family protein [Shinella sp. YZ44]MDG4675931.1 SCO family protein [Shinella sp. 838]TAA53041.1 SCO family protein [Shinella sp. JR1-6]